MTNNHSHRIPVKPVLWVESLNTNMLYEDFTDLTVPYHMARQAYEISADVFSVIEIEQALTWDFEGSYVDDFIRGVAARLLTNREVWLEVIVNGGDSRGETFYVWEVVGATTAKDGRFFQQPPDKNQLPQWFEIENDWIEPIELDPNRIVHVSLPDAYPNHILDRVVMELADIPSTSIPDWAMGKLMGTNPSAPDFDVNEADRVNQLRTLQAALTIGWPARQSLLGTRRQISAYYLARRELQFLHFIASMRERAEKALRETLAIASHIFGFEAKVTANGVHTPDAICGFIRDLETGELSYSDVNDLMYPRSDSANLELRRVVE